MVNVTIIGAGVAGLCVARILTNRGAQVRLIDRANAPGAHACSWWAGGMLAPFCEGESAEEPVVRLGQNAARWWQAQGVTVHQSGTLVVSPTRDHADLKRFSRRTTGFDEIDAAQIDMLEPDLSGRFSRGLFFASEAHLTPRAALAHLWSSLEKDGVIFEQADVDPDAIPGLIIDCRGFRARDQITDLRGVKGEMLMLSCPGISLSRPVRLLHPRMPVYIVPRGDGIFMLGATMIEGAAGKNATARALLELLSAAYALNPALAEAEVLEIGVDSRPAFPDNLPRVTRTGNLIRANGLYRHGFLLAPALAEMVADALPELQEQPHAHTA